MSIDPALVKACCVTGYSSDLVALVLGESYHPGGLTLTRRLLDLVGCTPGTRLLDVAAGRGTTALLAAQEYAADVDGVDLAPGNVALASGAAAARDLADRVRFRVGDAESLPLPSATFDVVLCECALCTFPDKRRAVAEMARVLKPGGRIGLSDVSADPARLPPELTSVAAWAACVADARPAAEYAAILEEAGLQVRMVESHPAAVRRMVDQIAARLDVLRLTARERLEASGLNIGQARPALAAARDAVAAGVLGYAVIVAEKPSA